MHVSKDNNFTGGYVDRPFYIHQKKGNSFQVRKGNFVIWNENEFLTIVLAKERQMKSNIDTSKSMRDIFLDFVKMVLDNREVDKENEKEMQSAKRMKFRWVLIEGIG